MDVEKFNEALFSGALSFLDELSSKDVDENVASRLGQLEQFKYTNFKNI